jgi:small subunit ribosomal protein S17
MADESRNESTENEETTPAEGQGETVSAPEGPVAPAAQQDAGEGDTAAEVEDAAVVPAREPAPDEPVAEEAVAEEPEPPVAEAEPAPDVEAEAAAAEAPADENAAAAPTVEAPQEPEPRRKRKRLPRMQRPRRRKPTRERPAERKPIARLAKPVHERGRRQERRGVVVSSAMDKTIVVRVDAVKAHPKYKKVVRRSTKFHAHDEQNQAKVGDIVRIVETRPLSKTKNWRLAEIVEVAK